MTTDRGDGIGLLADLVGIDADSMRRDPAKLAHGLAALLHEGSGLIRGYTSDDPEVRAAAERRWAELAAMLPRDREARASGAGSNGAGLSDADRERLRAGLTRVVRTLEQIRDDAGLGDAAPEREPPAASPPASET